MTVEVEEKKAPKRISESEASQREAKVVEVSKSCGGTRTLSRCKNVFQYVQYIGQAM